MRSYNGRYQQQPWLNGEEWMPIPFFKAPSGLRVP
jgi:hypothetical protein